MKLNNDALSLHFKIFDISKHLNMNFNISDFDGIFGLNMQMLFRNRVRNSREVVTKLKL